MTTRVSVHPLELRSLTAWDTAIALTLIVSFASWLVTHVAIAFKLLKRHQPRWTVWLLVLPPLFWLAPYWGLRYRLLVWVTLWFICVLVYSAALTLAVLGTSGG